MMDMRLRSEVKGKVCSSWNFFSLPRILMKVSAWFDRRNSYSMLLAASTSAISSGEGPW